MLANKENNNNNNNNNNNIELDSSVGEMKSKTLLATGTLLEFEFKSQLNLPEIKNGLHSDTAGKYASHRGCSKL